MKVNNLLNKKFGRLTVLSRVDNDKKGNSCWLCKCDCGELRIVKGYKLTSGNSKSCGCITTERMIKLNKTHGLSNYKNRLYRVWLGLKQRCYNKNNPAYHYYGERGITICDEWKNDFVSFYNWAINNGYDEKLSLDRKNNNDGYNPKNCRWATCREQSRNTRRNRLLTWDNKTYCISEWEEIMGFNRGILGKRIFIRGWSVEKALTTPSKRGV